MTVQELIDELIKVEDKSKKVNVYDNRGCRTYDACALIEYNREVTIWVNVD